MCKEDFSSREISQRAEEKRKAFERTIAKPGFWKELASSVFEDLVRSSHPDRTAVVGLRVFEDGFSIIRANSVLKNEPVRLTGYFIDEEAFWWACRELGYRDIKDFSFVVSVLKIQDPDGWEWQQPPYPGAVIWEPGTPDDRKIINDIALLPPQFNKKNEMIFKKWNMPDEYVMRFKEQDALIRPLCLSGGGTGLYRIVRLEDKLPKTYRSDCILMIPWNGGDYGVAASQAYMDGFGGILLVGEMPEEYTVFCAGTSGFSLLVLQTDKEPQIGEMLWVDFQPVLTKY